MVTAQMVFDYLKIERAPDPLEMETMERVVASVAARIDGICVPWPMSDDDPPVPVRPIEVVHAIVMSAARLWRRRTTPEGVLPAYQSGSDMGTTPLRVSRIDPDIEALIEQYRDLPVG